MRVLAIAVLLLFSLAGCGGKVPPSHYYTLELLPAPPAAATAYPVVIAVPRFQAPRPLTQDRLVFRPSPNKVDFYEYHRWVEAPPDMVTRHLLKRLKAAGIFRAVTGSAGSPQVDYILRGNIENLEEVDSTDTVVGRVVLTAELVDAKTRAVVWSGRGSHEALVEPRSIEGIVRVLNEGVHQSSDQLLRGLTAWFQQRPAQ